MFPTYYAELEKAVKNCSSILDLGCGNSSPVQYFSKKTYCVGVDAFAPSIEKSKKLKIHNKYYKLDVLDAEKKFKPASFDCVLALDLIEHLTKEDGIKLIKMIEKIAKKKVVIFTPNGFIQQKEYDNNKLQVHKSGWAVEEMQHRGYRVLGIHGWKPLRGKHAAMRFWPKRFWAIISDMTQLLTRNHPKFAFQLLCVKTKK